jgi:hypothetical protein
MKKLVLVVLALVLLIPAGSAQASSSPSWKQCGKVHFAGKDWIRSEAKAVGCRKALKVTRVIASRPGYPTCDTATHCQIEGFSCEIENLSKRVICVSGEARIRMRPAHQD